MAHSVSSQTYLRTIEVIYDGEEDADLIYACLHETRCDPDVSWNQRIDCESKIQKNAHCIFFTSEQFFIGSQVFSVFGFKFDPVTHRTVCIWQKHRHYPPSISG